MSTSYLNAPHLHDEEAAYRYVEERVWPTGPVCPRCGGQDRIGKLQGESTRIGVYKCYACRKPLTVKVGTIFEDSHIELKLWLQAIFLIASSKKGISSNQLHRILGITLKSAWHLSHRIRLAMDVQAANSAMMAASWKATKPTLDAAPAHARVAIPASATRM